MRTQTRMVWMAMILALVALAGGEARAVTNWWDGPDGGWEVSASWSDNSAAATPDPAVPGSGDTAIFSIDPYNTGGKYISLNANQAIYGMIFRNTAGQNIRANENTGQAGRTLTIGAGGVTTLAGSGNLAYYSRGALTLAIGADQVWRPAGGAISLLHSATPDAPTSRVIITDQGNNRSLTLVFGTLNIGCNAVTAGLVTNNAITSLSALNLGAGGYLQITSSGANFWPDRIGDSIPINSYGGTFYDYINTPGATVPYTETVGTVSLVKGALNQVTSQNVASGTNVLTCSGLSQSGTATLLISGAGLGVTTDTRNRLIINGKSTATIIGGWATVDGGGFASYDTTAYLGYARGVYGNVGSTLQANTSDSAGIYNIFNAPAAPTVNLTVGALSSHNTGSARTLALGAYNLTIAQGGLFFDGDAVGAAHTISGASGGKVMAGSGSDANLYVTVATAANQAGVKTISAVIADNGSGKLTLVKSGLGTLTASAENTYSGNTVINEGKINLSTAGSMTNSPLIEILYGATLDVSSQSSTWTLRASQTLGGSGTLNGNASISGTVAPGVTGLPTGAGTLSVSGNITFANNSVFAVEAKNALLGGDKWQPGYDRMEVVGTVDLGSNAKLDISLLSGESLAVGDRLFIIDNDSTDAVSGKFKTMDGTVLNNEGDSFTDGKSFKIYYGAHLATGALSGGNDVALEVIPPLVTLTVTDNSATEATPVTDTGVFTIARGNATNGALTVYYGLSGTADPNQVPMADYTNNPASSYASMTGAVTIADGSSNVTITVWPLDDSAQEGNETIILTLSNNAAYTLVAPSNGTVTLYPDGDSSGNAAPVVTNVGKNVTITMGEDGAAPTWVAATLYATDNEGNTLTWTNGAVTPLNGTVGMVNFVGSNLTSYTYTPDANFSGTNTFTMEVRDTSPPNMDACTVTVVVAAINDPPVKTGDPTISSSPGIWVYTDTWTNNNPGTWQDNVDTNAAYTAANFQAGKTFLYQWQWSNSPAGTAITDATNAAFIPNDFGGYVGTNVRVRVWCVDSGVPGSVTSAPADSVWQLVYGAPVQAPAITNAGPLSITVTEDAASTNLQAVFHLLATNITEAGTLTWSVGTAATQGTVTVVDTTVSAESAEPDTFTYQPTANRNGGDTFVLTVSNSVGGLTSNITVNITITAVNDAPTNTALPQVTGTLVVGQEVTATSGTWNDNVDTNAVFPASTITYNYDAWQRADDANGANLTTLTTLTDKYTLTSSEAMKYVRVLVTATDDGRPGTASATATSAWTYVERQAMAFTNVGSGRFNASSTWTPSTDYPRVPGDTAVITAYVVTNSAENEVGSNVTVTIMGSGKLTCADSGSSVTPIHSNATININTGATLLLDHANVKIGCRRVNLDGGTLLFNGGSLAAGSVLNVNSNSFVTPVDSSDLILISSVVHGTNSLTLTADTQYTGGAGACAFAVGSDWTGAWNIQGNIRMDSASSSRNTPGSVRVSANKTMRFNNAGLYLFKGTRSGYGTNAAPNSCTFQIGTNTASGVLSPGDIGVNNGVGAVVFSSYIANSNAFLIFHSNSTYEVDIRGTANTQYDYVSVGATGTGTVSILSGSILTVNLWRPLSDTNLEAKIIDTLSNTGEGVLTGSFGATNWTGYTNGWTLTVVNIANDLMVTGTYVNANTAPVIDQAGPITINMNEDGGSTNLALGITLTATDAEGDAVAWTNLTTPAHGTVVCGGTGTNLVTWSSGFTYTLTTPNFNGTDTFKVKAYDNYGGVSTVTVDVVVAPVNDAPVNTVAPGYTNVIFTIDALWGVTNGIWNDDLDTNATYTAADFTGQAEFAYQWQYSNSADGLVYNLDGATESTYTPAGLLNTNIRVRVICTDSNQPYTVRLSTTNHSAWTLVTSEANVAPVITNTDPQSVVLVEDAAVTNLQLLFNLGATDANTNPTNTLTWSVQSGPSKGQVTVGGSGYSPSSPTTLEYQPTANTNGSDSFVVQVSDGQVSDTITVNVTIDPVNDAPTNTVLPTVAGAVYRAGVELTSTTGTWNDDKDSGTIVGYTYRWQRANDNVGTGAADIDGATGSAYTPVTADVGKYLSVKVTATDNGSPLPAAINTVASSYVGPVLRTFKTFTAIASNRFNVASTWDQPDGISGPPLAGDTANIGGECTVTTLSDNEVASGVTVNIQNSGKLQLAGSGTSAISPIHSNATVNVASNGTLEIQSTNNVVGTINLNGGTLSHNSANGGQGNLAAGATLNINSNSFLTPISTAHAKINCPVHGTGKFTLTADASMVNAASIQFASESTWSGAWDFKGDFRISTIFQQRYIPGDERVAIGKRVQVASITRTIKGTRSGSGTDQLSGADSIMTLGDGTNSAALSPGDGSGGVGAVTVETTSTAGTNMTFVFNTNSTYIVDVTGTVSTACDTLTVAGFNTGTGNVQVVNGAKLVVSLWKPTTDTNLDATIIDGTGAKIGSDNFAVTWSNTAGWSGLTASWTGPDLHVTGTYTVPVVTLVATTTSAYENAVAPTAGVFTVSRGSRTDGNLVVNYRIAGTATPGGDPNDYTLGFSGSGSVDYAAKTGTVTIADGAASATITVTSFDDALIENVPETVILSLTNGVYTIGFPSNDTVTITSDDAGNLPPEVSAGTNQTVVVNTLPTGDVALNGSATDDGVVNATMTYQWSKQSGLGTVTFGNSNLLATTATFDAADVYVLQLVADDGGMSATGTVSITVHTNTAPVVDAGADQAQPFAAGAVTLSGTLAPDDGLPAAPTYAWSKDSGPGTVTFGNSNLLSTTASFGQAGTYVLRLTANDTLATGTDTLTVTLRAPITFTAIAGSRFNAAGTWDAPGGVSGPPLQGDTANIGGGFTVTTSNDNEVASGVTVNIQSTGKLQLVDPVANAISPVHSGAIINVATGGTLEIQGSNNVVGVVNLNGGTLSHNGNTGNLAAGATLNINSDSFLTPTPAGTGLPKILCPVHGTGKLTLTANANTVAAGILFAAGSDWSGAWDFQGNIRFSTFQQRHIPGDARVAAGKKVEFVSTTARTIKGTRSGFGTDTFAGVGTQTLGDGSGNGVLSPGDSAGGVGAVTMAAYGSDVSHTFVFNAGSTYIADIHGTAGSAYDKLTVSGNNTGTGNVQVVSGAKLTVNLWLASTTNVTLDATIIDGSGAKLGSDDFVVTWINTSYWTGLAVTWIGPDLHVTGTYEAPEGSIYRFQ